MAKFTYKGTDYPLEETLTNVEALQLEVATGHTLPEVINSFAKRGMLGLNAMLWLCMTRAGEKIAYKDLTYSLDDLTYDDEDEGTEGAVPDPSPAPAAARPKARSRKK
ncbi:hypothetical protein [Allokutzneria albata]|uniref:Uncharacterized protein n=1 Tax=Allokutzneria albata TaxID=211114 RepID=A0A1H0DV21_ALLAB|nr:hypothetical protein [Allokutzneria albata]SDN73909.1 hypothetical protein SAMN04489726_8006 [Allokutzneria albata]